MITFNELMLLILAVVVLVLLCVVVGGWLVWKSKAGPGEGFIRSPKGQAFTIPGSGDELYPMEEPSEEEKELLGRTKEFLARLGGIE